MTGPAGWRRLIVVGDVHGCIDELRELLTKVDYVATGRDRVVFVGDLLDRGPDSAACVRLAQQLDAVLVMGNHEERALRWKNYEQRVQAEPGFVNPMPRPHADCLRQWGRLTFEDWQYLARARLTYRETQGGLSVLVIHAGMEAAIGGDESAQKRSHLLRLRWTDAAGHAAGLRTWEPPAGSVPWATAWAKLRPGTFGTVGPQHKHDNTLILYGHEPRSLTDPARDAGDNVFLTGLDTGCCYGGNLSAQVIEWFPDGRPLAWTSYIAQVRARRVYFPRHAQTVQEVQS